MKERINSESEFGGYDLAELETGLARGTIYSKVCRKQIPHIRLGNRLIRFNRKQLQEWMGAHQVSQASPPRRPKTTG